MSDDRNIILSLIDRHHQRLLTDWLACQQRDVHGSATADRRPKPASWRAGSSRNSAAARRVAQFEDIQAAEWQPMRELLEDLSRDRALQGFTPSETADLRLFAEGAAVRAAAPGDRHRRRPAGPRDLDRQSAARQAGPLHHRVLREDPRGGDHPPAAGDAGTLHPGGRSCGTASWRCR